MTREKYSNLHDMGHCMGAFYGADDALRPGQVLKGFHCLVIGNRNVLRSADIMEMGMFRPDTGIIQSCRDGVDRKLQCGPEHHYLPFRAG